MRRHLSLALLIAVAASLTSACITVTNIVKLKPSGSGTLEATIQVNTAVFKQVGAMMGGGEVKSESKSNLPSPEELAKELSKMKGVRLVSQKAFKEGDTEGVKVVMAFDDVNQISVSENLPAKGGKTKPEDEVTFSLIKQAGGTSVLAISFPDKPGEALKGDAAKKAESAKKPSPEALQMLSAFFKGMRVMIAVDVDGTLVRTSSPYVEGNRVTLLDFDMDQLLKDPAAFEKLNTLPLGPDMSITDAREALAKAGVKGIKVNEPHITIEMK